MRFLVCCVAGLLISVSLSGCDRGSSEAERGVPTATDGGGLHRIAEDVMTDPLVPGEVSIWIEMDGAVRLDGDGRNLIVPVKVANEGSRPLSASGRYPVNLGVQIAGNDGTASSEPGVQDFVRTPLPDLPAGASVTVDVTIPADGRLDGRMLLFDLVQEGVAWFSTGFDQPLLEVGPFELCGSVFCEIHDDGSWNGHSLPAR
jgi:hypothetical protein